MSEGTAWRWTRGAVSGGTCVVALWCMLFAMQVLPGPLARHSGYLTLAIAGMVAGAVGLARVLFAALVASAALMSLVVLSPLSDDIQRRWVRDDPLPPSGLAAVVVLSGGVNPDTTISSDALDHLLTGLEVVRRAREAVLITTSTREAFPNGIISGETDQARIVAMAGSPAVWMRVPGGRSTRDEAVATAAALRGRRTGGIAVVASPMHTRRACAVFEAVGFAVTCVAARLRGPGGYPLSANPRGRLTIFGEWVYETAAIAMYACRGWLPPNEWPRGRRRA